MGYPVYHADIASRCIGLMFTWPLSSLRKSKFKRENYYIQNALPGYIFQANPYVCRDRLGFL